MGKIENFDGVETVVVQTNAMKDQLKPKYNTTMTKEQLKDFVELDQRIAELIGQVVSIHNDFGWVRGRLRWNGHSWELKGDDVDFDFDTDDVKMVSENSIFFHPKTEHITFLV